MGHIVEVVQSGQVSLGTLSTAVKVIVDTLNTAGDQLQGSTGQLTRSLALLEIGLGLVAVLQGDRPSNLLRKALAVATWTWIIGDFHRIGLSFMHFLVDKSSGAFGQKSDIMLQPSKILELSTKVTKPMLDKLDASHVAWDAGTIILLGLVLLAIVFAYIALALSISLAVIEFYLYLALSGLLLPFAVFGHTRFLADKAINAVISCALKLAVITFVTGTIAPILEQLKFEPGMWNSLTWRCIWGVLVTVGLAAALAMWAPRLAAGFLHASPSLSGTAVVSQAASVASDMLQSGFGYAKAAMRATQGEVTPRKSDSPPPDAGSGSAVSAGISSGPAPTPPTVPGFGLPRGGGQSSGGRPWSPGGDEPMLPGAAV